MTADLLVVYKKNFEEVHDRSLAAIQSMLGDLSLERDISTDFTARERVRRSDFVGRDLVIVLGGDGTLTSISHNIDALTPVMGVNSHPRSSDPDGSFGFYMGTDVASFARDVRAALDGEGILNRLPRLQADIVSTSGNRQRSDPALNDLLLANSLQYAPSKYRMQREADGTHGPLDVAQLSSGLLFSTFLGQGAWFRHICNIEGIRFPVEEVETHYLVVARDLPRGDRDGVDGAYWAWTDKPTVITSDMHRGYIVPDGWDEYHFNRGATITLGLHAPALSLLTFDAPLVERVGQWLDE